MKQELLDACQKRHDDWSAEVSVRVTLYTMLSVN